MKILNRVGGAFLLLVLVAAAVLGFQTPTGRQIWTGIWAAVSRRAEVAQRLRPD